MYITIGYLMTDQPVEMDRFVKYLLSAVVVTICADGLGVFLGTVLNPVVSAELFNQMLKSFVTTKTSFAEWNFRWRRFDVVYADVFRLPHPAESHSGCHAIHGLYIATSLRPRKHGDLAVRQSAWPVDLPAHGVLLPLQVSESISKLQIFKVLICYRFRLGTL